MYRVNMASFSASLCMLLVCMTTLSTGMPTTREPEQVESSCPPDSISYRPLPPSTRSANVLIILDQTTPAVPLYRKLIPSIVTNMERGLKMLGIGSGPAANLYSLAGFGFGDDASNYTRVHQTAGGLNQFPASSIHEISAALTQGPSHKEDAYLAIHQAFQEINFTTSADTANILVVVSDEDRDVLDATLEKSSMKNIILSQRFTPHFVVFQSFNCAGAESNGIGAGPYGRYFTSAGECAEGRLGTGYGTTVDDYSSLALDSDLGGSVWNIERLSGGDPGVANLFLSEVLLSAHATTSSCSRCDCRGSAHCVGEAADSRACHCLAYDGKWNTSPDACQV